METEPEYVWSRNNEDFMYTELGDLIDAEDDLHVGSVVYRGVPKRYEPSRFVPSADWVVEHMADRAYDDGGEWAEDWPTVSVEACEELESLLKEWAAKNCNPCTFWRIDKSEPYTITEEDLA